jgi:AraC-like DNA-binding protein
MDQILSTCDIPEDERFEYWRAQNSQRHVQFDIRRLDYHSPFQAQLQGARLGELIFGISCLSAIEGVRTRQHIATDHLGHYVLGIPRQRSIVEQDGMRQEVKENAMVLFDTTRPLRYRHAHQGGGITVAIPRHCLAHRLEVAEQKGLRIAALDRGVGLMVRSFCHDLPAVIAGGADIELRQMLANQLLALLSLAFRASGDGQEQAEPSLMQLRFRRILAYIDEHLGDSDLEPSQLLQVFGISRSYLYKLFAQHEFCFQDHLRQRRLQRVAADLRNPALDHLSITALAVHAGFTNITHFNRCFKQYFDEAPGAYRKAR